MTSWTTALQATALCLALLWLLLTLVQPRKPALVLVWALFCASIGFWLVARAVFREGRPFGTVHLAYAGLIGVLIVASQLLGFGSSLGWIGPEWRLPLAAALGETLNLLSSVVLVLAFWEGLRGFSAQRAAERGVRVVFLVTYGGCVGATSLADALASEAGANPQLMPLVAAAAALSILLVAQGLVHWRLRHPLGGAVSSDTADERADRVVAVNAVANRDVAAQSQEDDAAHAMRTERVPGSAIGTDAGIAWPTTDAAASRRAPGDVERDEDRTLASRLERHLRAQRSYLRAELKLAHLAQALDVSEYRISRAIHTLGHRNSAHYINAFRIEHACVLLRDPASAEWSTLVIGLESGFGSLGAFHRAFKAAIGCTPGEYRTSATPEIATDAI
jgi:AraC-like DNA-binding protein